MNIVAFLVFLFGLQLVCLFVGRGSSRNLQNQEDYFLAGRGIKFFPLMMTFLATQVGGGLVLGSAEEAYKYGWSVLLYPLGASLGLIVLGAGIGRKMAQFQVSTIAQIFEVAYRSPLLKKVASGLSMVSLFMVLIGQIIASKKFMVTLGVESTPIFIAFWGIVILYTAWGGFKAVVSTDIVQAGFFFLAFLLTMGYAIYGNSAEPLTGLFEESAAFKIDTSKVFGWLILPLLFMVIEQDMGQRCFAAKSPKTVSQATWLAGLLTLAVCTIPIFFGMAAKNLGLEIPRGASVLMVAVKEMTNPVVTAMVGCAILAAIVSTADSLINAIGSNLAQDFDVPALKRLKLSQALAAVISLTAIFFSFFFDNVVDMLMLSYEISVSCLFVPIFAALFKRQGNFSSAVFAIMFGLVGFNIFRVIDLGFPRELASILLSAAGFFLGELLAKEQKRLVKEVL